MLRGRRRRVDDRAPEFDDGTLVNDVQTHLAVFRDNIYKTDTTICDHRRCRT